MTANATHRAEKTRSTFRMTCSVECVIHASPDRVWSLLTSPPEFPRWNTTVTRIDGTIALGERLRVQVPAAPGRTFKPRVTAFEPGKRMVWSDGAAPMFRGVRTFTVAPSTHGGTAFSMAEVFTGVMLPLIAGSLPDFGPIFEAYAADLKREAEKAS